MLHTFETKNDNVTVCNFTAGGTGETAKFTSNDAVEPSENTSWKALYGAGATVSGTTITCGYDGQDGTLANLKKYDYMIATGIGTSPSFDFSTTTSTRLSYFIRLKLPAGIKAIEVNTCGSWSVTNTANTAPTPSTDDVTEISLESATTSENNVVYIAVPAIDYSVKGLTITIFNNVKTSANYSQGKVMSQNLSSKGGKITTLDMSDLTTMLRPTTYVDMGTAGTWAAFNVGASNETGDYGFYYQWGKTEQSKAYDIDQYSNKNYDWTTYFPNVSSANEETCGKASDPINVAGLLPTGSISNTKFDVARVKWGKGWRMPENSDFINLSNLSHIYVYNIYDKIKFTNSTTSQSLFLTLSGYCHTVTGAYQRGQKARFWSGTASSITNAHYLYLNKDNNISNSNENRDYGFSVRPIYKE